METQAAKTLKELSPDPYREYLKERRRRLDSYYSNLEHQKISWSFPRRYLRQQIIRALKSIIPKDKKVLDIGCGHGDILEALEPSRGVGIDLCRAQIEIAQRRASSSLNFKCMAAENCSMLEDQFDYITLVNVTGEMIDIPTAFQQLRTLCKPNTRIILCIPRPVHWPLFYLAKKFRLSIRSPRQNWLNFPDIATFVKLSDFEIISRSFFCPFPPPAVHGDHSIWRWIGRMPLLRGAGLYELIMLRPMALSQVPNNLTTTVVVPCKNEEKNIDEIIRRMPAIGSGVELIFVYDQSSDATAEKIRENIRRYPERNIKVLQGPDCGKGAAVRVGFEHASGDIYMIFDADMTVAPECLPQFYDCVASQKSDFVTGSRMIYPMVGAAMRPLNIIGNKFFAMLSSFILGQPIKDTLCGTKVIRAADYWRILSARKWWNRVDRWGDYDWLFGAAKNHMKILEIPVHYFERKEGVTKMTRRFYNAWFMLRMCWLAFRRLR